MGVDLLPYNTFHVCAKAKYFTEINTPEDLKDLPKEKSLVLGRGANMLFTKDFDGLIIKNNLLGKEVIKETDEAVAVEASSGEDWIKFVDWAVDKELSGVENLAYIPGTVGAAPIQNIAAYGQSFEDVFVNVRVVDLKSGKEQVLSKNECQLSYRESVFKKNPDYFVTAVTMRLPKTPQFALDYHSRYESLAAILAVHPETPYTPKEVAEAVTKLRQIKLPDWKKVGTAGSFFQNPNVTMEKYKQLSQEIKELQSYPANKLQYPDAVNDAYVKIPAGRLLDELGWKGKRIGNVGTYEKHALLVVNYGGASGQEILDFTQQMQTDVKKHYGINLEPEVNII